MELLIRCLELGFIFFLGVISDICWGYWHKTSTEKKAVASANWSVGIIISGMLYIKAVSESDWLAVTLYIIGAWIGMYLSIRKK